MFSNLELRESEKKEKTVKEKATVEKTTEQDKVIVELAKPNKDTPVVMSKTNKIVESSNKIAEKGTVSEDAKKVVVWSQSQQKTPDNKPIKFPPVFTRDQQSFPQNLVIENSTQPKLGFIDPSIFSSSKGTVILNDRVSEKAIDKPVLRVVKRTDPPIMKRIKKCRV